MLRVNGVFSSVDILQIDICVYDAIYNIQVVQTYGCVYSNDWIIEHCEVISEKRSTLTMLWNMLNY